MTSTGHFDSSDVTERVATKLYAFYAALPEDEQSVVADLFRMAASMRVDVVGYQAGPPRISPESGRRARAFAERINDLIAAGPH